MNVRQLIEVYETFCPPSLSLEGDSVGLQLGRFDKKVTKLMLTLDVREEVVAEAIKQGVDMIITKHAPIHKGLKDLVSSPQRDILLDLVKHDIAVYVSHTNIDVVNGGLNDWFCDLLDVSNRDILSETQAGQGIGRVGNISPISFEVLALKIKRIFQLDSIRLVSYRHENPLISRIAICGGSGDDFYPAALAKGAQVYITGDIYYHTAQEMLTEGLLGIDPGHHIEVLFVSKLEALFTTWKQNYHWDIEIIGAKTNTNPFYHL